MVLTVLFIEIAGMLASAHVSVSAPILFALLTALCEWPRLEGLFSSAIAGSTEEPAARLRTSERAA